MSQYLTKAKYSLKSGDMQSVKQYIKQYQDIQQEELQQRQIERQIQSNSYFSQTKQPQIIEKFKSQRASITQQLQDENLSLKTSVLELQSKAYNTKAQDYCLLRNIQPPILTDVSSILQEKTQCLSLKFSKIASYLTTYQQNVKVLSQQLDQTKMKNLLLQKELSQEKQNASVLHTQNLQLIDNQVGQLPDIIQDGGDNEQLLQENSRLKSELLAMKTQIASGEQRCKFLTAQTSELEQTVQNLKNTEKKDNVGDELVARNDELSQEIKNLRSQNDKLVQDVAKLQELSQKQGIVVNQQRNSLESEYKQQISQLQDEIEGLSRNKNDNIQQVQALQQKIDEYKQKFQQEQHSNQAMSAKVNELEIQASTLHQQLDLLSQSNSQQSSAQQMQMLEEVGKLKLEISASKALVEQKTTDCQNLEGDLVKLRELHQQQTQQNNELYQEVSTLKKECTKITNESQVSNNKLKNQQEEMQLLAEEQSKLVKLTEEQKMVILQQKSDIELLQSENADLKKNLQNALQKGSEDRNTVDQNIQQQQIIIDQLKLEIAKKEQDYNSKNEEKQNLIAELQKQMLLSKTDCQLAGEKLGGNQKIIDGLKLEISSLEKMLANNKQKPTKTIDKSLVKKLFDSSFLKKDLLQIKEIINEASKQIIEKLNVKLKIPIFNNSSDQESSKLQQKIQLMEQEQEQLISNLAKQKKMVKDLEFQLSDLEATITSPEEVKDLEDKIQKLTSENTAFKEQLCEKDGKLKKLSNEVVSLEQLNKKIINPTVTAKGGCPSHSVEDFITYYQVSRPELDNYMIETAEIDQARVTILKEMKARKAVCGWMAESFIAVFKAFEDEFGDPDKQVIFCDRFRIHYDKSKSSQFTTPLKNFVFSKYNIAMEVYWNQIQQQFFVDHGEMLFRQYADNGDVNQLIFNICNCICLYVIQGFRISDFEVTDQAKMVIFPQLKRDSDSRLVTALQIKLVELAEK